MARVLCEDNEWRKKIADLAILRTNSMAYMLQHISKDRVETKEGLVSNSGAMQKNMDVVIGRRFKEQGISERKGGVDNLLKLRILRYYKNDSEEFWERKKEPG